MTSTSTIRHRRLNALQVMLQLWNRWVILPRLAHYLQTARLQYWQLRRCLVMWIKQSDLFSFQTHAWSKLFLFGSKQIFNYILCRFVLFLTSLISSIRGNILIYFTVYFYFIFLLFYSVIFTIHKERVVNFFKLIWSV